MIRLSDTVTLALTKLRTRKVRLGVTIAVAGLLFAGLAAASMVARGAFASINSFSQEGFGTRYITQAMANGTSEDIYQNPEVLDRATAIQKDFVARKKAEAKRLGLDYDEKQEVSPIQEFDTPNGKQRVINPGTVAGSQAQAEYIAAHPQAGLPDLQRLAMSYRATGFYQTKSPALGSAQAPSLQVLKDGKEAYDTQQNSKQYGPPSGVDTLTTSWAMLSDGLLQPFLLPGAKTTVGADGSLPIVAPYSAVEQLLDLKALPAGAGAEAQLARIKDVRARAGNLTVQVCYRNHTSSDLLGQAISAQAELERNKNNKDYQKPDFIYGLPDTACGPPSVARDVRSADQKRLDTKQQQFAEEFGTTPADQHILTFRVIGIAPDPFPTSVSHVGQILRNLVGSSLGPLGWYTPLSVEDADPTLKTLFTNVLNEGYPPSYFAEFANAADARKFLDKANCQPDFKALAQNGSTSSIDACKKAGKPFVITPFGSNSVALESAKRGFGRTFTIGALVVAVIAAVVMMGTVGRTIADSRRETAVFRAIGAKKLDITQIYLFYSVCLALLIAMFALIVGWIGAHFVSARYSQEATVQSLVIFNAQDLHRTFRFFAWNLRDLAFLVGLVFAGGLLSSIFPLLRNLRRNPMRDMRDDT